MTLFKRDPDTKYKTLLMDEYALPCFEYLKDNAWEFTEKVDGTNIRVMCADGIIRFGGKTNNALLPAKLIERLNSIFMPLREQLTEQFPEGVCFYGEGFGAGIQKGGGNYQSTQEFVLFDVKINNWWLERQNVIDIAEKFNLQIVPVVITRGDLSDMVCIVKRGFKSAWGDFPAEGIVARPTIGLIQRNGHRIITKLKTKDFVGR